jgi:hypothetical protein
MGTALRAASAMRRLGFIGIPFAWMTKLSAQRTTADTAGRRWSVAESVNVPSQPQQERVKAGVRNADKPGFTRKGDKLGRPVGPAGPNPSTRWRRAQRQQALAAPTLHHPA